MSILSQSTVMHEEFQLLHQRTPDVHMTTLTQQFMKFLPRITRKKKKISDKNQAGSLNLGMIFATFQQRWLQLLQNKVLKRAICPELRSQKAALDTSQ